MTLMVMIPGRNAAARHKGIVSNHDNRRVQMNVNLEIHTFTFIIFFFYVKHTTSKTKQALYTETKSDSQSGGIVFRTIQFVKAPFTQVGQHHSSRHTGSKFGPTVFNIFLIDQIQK